MFIVGITGGIGSGKSAVTRQLEQFGINVIDADIVAREVVAPGEEALQKIAQHFGSQILTNSGELNRAELRVKIFSDPKERKWLEQLLHPVIRARIIQQLDNTQSSYAVLASPLLLETDQHQLTDHIVVVDVPEAIQIERTISRDKNNAEQVKSIIQTQMPRDQKIVKADTIIDNSADLATLKKEVAALHSKLLTLAKQAPYSD
ncbi:MULTISPECIES: dephospho-CoA kinase [unclassified Neptuniibacter]|uniref:dephospho-CoA kinase n=1 Tax=unclassified Neptuniibacter TaxID=2630693 RepID=UPI0026E2F700|nr:MULTISPECIES: dephospho-CoA kinase [unclassified Neptuniibacter]MDO6512833.1 dephospho-CoA kinase [Neptuniibacter sp. 2_MG-2023]MDO6592983.1 dephospho-CoA kinase [Neptuniibacter sp. 1_MG-2023]